MDHDFGYGQYVDLEHYAGRVVKHYIPLQDNAVIHIKQPFELESGAQRFRYLKILRPVNSSDKTISEFSFRAENLSNPLASNPLSSNPLASNKSEKMLLSTICIIFILIAQLWIFHR